jgi:hypothetical protein
MLLRRNSVSKLWQTPIWKTKKTQNHVSIQSHLHRRISHVIYIALSGTMAFGGIIVVIGIITLSALHPSTAKTSEKNFYG